MLKIKIPSLSAGVRKTITASVGAALRPLSVRRMWSQVNSGVDTELLRSSVVRNRVLRILDTVSVANAIRFQRDFTFHELVTAVERFVKGAARPVASTLTPADQFLLDKAKGRTDPATLVERLVKALSRQRLDTATAADKVGLGVSKRFSDVVTTFDSIVMARGHTNTDTGSLVMLLSRAIQKPTLAPVIAGETVRRAVGRVFLESLTPKDGIILERINDHPDQPEIAEIVSRHAGKPITDVGSVAMSGQLVLDNYIVPDYVEPNYVGELHVF